MHGLPQAEILDNNTLKGAMAQEVLYEVTHTPSLWKN